MLWGDLDRAAKDFKKAYNIMMTIVMDIKMHYDPPSPKKENDA
jgi:hypothetical protein